MDGDTRIMKPEQIYKSISGDQAEALAERLIAEIIKKNMKRLIGLVKAQLGAAHDKAFCEALLSEAARGLEKANAHKSECECFNCEIVVELIAGHRARLDEIYRAHLKKEEKEKTE